MCGRESLSSPGFKFLSTTKLFPQAKLWPISHRISDIKSPFKGIISKQLKDSPDFGVAANPGSHFVAFFFLCLCFAHRRSSEERAMQSKVKMVVEKMEIVRLRSCQEHMMGTSLLYPAEAGWAQAQGFLPKEQLPKERS